MDCVEFLAGIDNTEPQSVYVIFGDELFLKRLAIAAVRRLVLNPDTAEFSFTSFLGDKASFADVMDELQTVSFFGDRRLVIVSDAESFVSKNRSLLEKEIQSLPDNATLVLDVKTWASNTKLAKLVNKKSAIACKALSAGKLPKWCVDWSANKYGKQMTSSAASQLVNLVGTEMGQLDQELQKLAISIGDRKRISDEDVDRMVGRNQAENTWKIFDAIADGNVTKALEILRQLFEMGEEPIRLLGAFSSQLRKIGQAARIATNLKKPLAGALADVGVQPFLLHGYEKQMRHLGPDRATKLYQKLTQMNLDLRGFSPLSPEALFERLVIELARPNTARSVRR